MKTEFLGTALVVALAAFPATAQNVKITPLGSHDGELCAMDRATLFEDPTGVRLLYDVGHTLTGSDDPRLGNIHIVLLSHPRTADRLRSQVQQRAHRLSVRRHRHTH